MTNTITDHIELMLPLLGDVHRKIPIIFDDLYEKYYSLDD